MLLQSVLGVYQDGALGPETLAAVAGKNTLRLIGGLAGAQRAWYMSRPGYKQFGIGWLNRLAARQALAMQMAKGAP
jgi:lysozyme family protein